jgi:UDP-glucose 4-epimerase
MKAIVTGGAGFIGSHIVRRLLSEGHEVIVIDNFHTGDIRNISDIKHRVKLVKGDSSRISKLGAADLVFHEGIPSSTPMYRDNPSLVAKALNDFIAVAEYCRTKNIRLVFASTSSIYNGYNPPHREDMTPFAKDLYTEARYPMERISEVYRQMFGFSYAALRYFSVYGDREESKKNFANLISQTIWKGLRDKSMKVYGDGSQRRDFTNIDDIVEANIIAASSKADGVFNVGTGKSYSINEMFPLVEKTLGKEIKREYIRNPLKNYVDVVEADTSKSASALGFKANVGIEDGIGRAVKYYRSLNLKYIPDIE